MASLAYAAVWIFVFTVPWGSVFAIVPGVDLITKAAGALALGSALGLVMISGRVRRWHAFHVTALLFVLWIAFVLLSLYSGWRLPKNFWTFVQLFLVLFIIWELAPSWRHQIGLLVAYVLGTYVAALDTILLFRREAGALRRFAAGGGDANDLAMTLALALPMAWYLGMAYRQPLLRWVCRGYLPIALVAIGLTGSRGGMLATMTALLIVPLTMTKLSPGRLATGIVLLGLSGALAVAYIPETLMHRLATTRTEVQEGGISGRLRIWKAGVNAFTRQPVMGYGVGHFKTAVSPWLGSSAQAAHNSYLSVLVEEGMVGLLLYLTMIGSVLMAVLNLPLLERRFALVLLATLGVAMLPLTWEDNKAAWFILAALLGMSQAQVTGTGGAVRPARPRRAAPTFHRPVTARSPESLGAPGRTANRNAPG